MIQRTQQTQLDAAIERAERAGLEVVGTGHRRSDNARIYAVPSQSEPNRWHIVAVVGSRLVCDCVASQYGKICCHRAAVHVELTVQAARREAAAAEIAEQLELEQRDREVAEELAARAKRREAAILVRSPAAFSIFK